MTNPNLKILMSHKNLHLFYLLFFLCSNLIAQGSDPFGTSTPKDSTSPKEALVNLVDDEIEFGVKVITCQELDTKIKNHEPVIILDARNQRSFEKSHIIGAKRVGNEDFSVERVWTIDRNSSIVVYGDNGVNSEDVGTLLLQMGFKDVSNLYGSIQEWANYGGELVNVEGKATKKVINVADKPTKKKRKRNRKKK